VTLFAGIDGGQSSTVAIVGDARVALGRGSGPPADLVGEARGSSRQADALDTALAAALVAARLDPRARFDAIVAGISGFDDGSAPAPDLTARTASLRVVHDTEIAHAGALGGAAGIVVVAGTGSVALGNDDSAPARFVRAGGWGYFFGDEGSALWIARRALRRAMLRTDRGEPSALVARALAFFGANAMRAIQHGFAHGEIGRPALAAFSSEVLASAAAGDPDASEVYAAAIQALADLAALVDRRLAPAALRLVSGSGGLFSDAAFARSFGVAVQSALPHAKLVAPAFEPALGALARARTLA
jgi:glucosamine kinase